MHCLTSMTVALFAGVGFGATVSSLPLVLHEKRTHAPKEWVRKTIAPRDLVLPIQIGVTPKNVDQGHDALMSVSDPRSANFGKHWTPQQVQDFFAPDHDTIDNIRTWLHESGVGTSRHSIAPSRGYITFLGSVDEVERLFGSSYELFEHAETGELAISCEEYHIPNHLKRHIDFISPTIGFDSKHSPGLRKRDDLMSTRRPPFHQVIDWKLDSDSNELNCTKLITPECIRALYGFDEACDSVPGNDLGIYAWRDTFDQEDLNAFFTTYASNIPNGTTPNIQSIDGGVGIGSLDDAGGETQLDLNVAYPIVYPQNITVYANFPGRKLGIFNDFLDALDGSYCTYQGGDDHTVDPQFPNPKYNHTEMCGVYKPANVISFSYALAEAFYSPFYAQRQCHEYLKLGLQGTSLLFASGDQGTVSGGGIYGCLDDGRYNPQFPASCPYVTAVGATELPLGASVDKPEKAAFADNQGYSSGGGFSNVFARPSWQEEAVSTFFENPGHPLPPSARYNASGRAFPDVSANGRRIIIALWGLMLRSDGTSASTPLFASLINRINGERIKIGKGPLGFLNPTLYQHPEVFNDITKGFNEDCDYKGAFNATEGWDPVTGLGTPDYPKLLDLFMSLP